MTSAAEREDDDLVAAEYVLGTLDAGEREAFAERLRADGGAKRAVSEWERRLAGLAGKVAPLAPPPHLWSAIEEALQGPAPARTFRVVDGGGLLAEGAPKLERSRNRWRVSAISLGAIAAALVAFVAVDRAGRVAPPEPAGSYVAAINRGGDKPAMLVRVDLGTRKIFVLPVAAQAPADRSLELWYIGDDKTPRAMGLVDKQPSTLAMPEGTAPGATLAISVEPRGGSTTGGPTGPVVYSGQLVKE